MFFISFIVYGYVLVQKDDWKTHKLVCKPVAVSAAAADAAAAAQK